MKALIFLQVLIIAVVIMIGCQDGMILSDPNVVGQIEVVAEQGITLTQILGMLFPALLPIGTAAAGLLAMYKRLKPKIKAAQDETDKYHAGGATLAMVLEDIKTNEPEMWKKIGPEIAKATSTSKDIESAIRGFRGI